MLVQRGLGIPLFAHADLLYLNNPINTILLGAVYLLTA